MWVTRITVDASGEVPRLVVDGIPVDPGQEMDQLCEDWRQRFLWSLGRGAEPFDSDTRYALLAAWRTYGAGIFGKRGALGAAASKKFLDLLDGVSVFLLPGIRFPKTGADALAGWKPSMAEAEECVRHIPRGAREAFLRVCGHLADYLSIIACRCEYDYVQSMGDDYPAPRAVRSEVMGWHVEAIQWQVQLWNDSFGRLCRPAIIVVEEPTGGPVSPVRGSLAQRGLESPRSGGGFPVPFLLDSI